MTIKKTTIKTKGMTCNSCEKIIARSAIKIPGVIRAASNYEDETCQIEYDSSKTNINEIILAIENKGYNCQDNNQNNNPKKKSLIYWGFISIGLLAAIYFTYNLYSTFNLPTISQNMGYGLLFVVGLLTGFHCIGMCGGFVVSYTTKGVKENKKPLKLHTSYAIGKTLSYTVIGALFGLLGSIVAFTPQIRGIAGIVAGLFLVIFGLKMLNIFPNLRKLKINLKTPKFIRKFINKNRKKTSNPLTIGLLNGLMIACGPLQAIYIMAAGSASMIEGAKMLFVFGIGTLPVMLGFGYITSFFSKKATTKVLKASGVIVIILGVIMLNRGLALSGTGFDYNSITAGFDTLGTVGDINSNGDSNNNNVAIQKGDYQEISMDVVRYGWSQDKFILKKGVPVRWKINGKEINGCNNAIQVPSLNLNFKITPGEQIIEFTPTKTGKISWSCWMGMIPGIFIVEDNINSPTQDINEIELPAGSCGGGSGGCGCGGA
jgi:uncharacterized protein